MTGRRLDGKVAVITGGASGIGQACALRFAEEGARILIADMKPGDETLQRIRAAGGEAETLIVDTTSDRDCESMIDAAVGRFGHVDVGVFAAGIRLDPIPVLELDTPVFQRMLDINLTGVMRSARALARKLTTQGKGGSIVNIASTAGKIPIEGSGAYCMAKAGVIMLTKVMALELARTGIRVNAVAPGFTSTPMWAVAEDSDENRWAMAMTPMKRTGTPLEQANTCLFLASDESSYMTGQTLYPAGGQFVD